MPDKPHNRYDIRMEPTGLWTVYDIFTGLPAVINDIPMILMDLDDANDVVELLNYQYIKRRKGKTE